MNKKTAREPRRPHPRMLTVDPYLTPFADQIADRIAYCRQARERLLDGKDILSFANGHLYYGFHRTETGWVFREHAPNAAAINEAIEIEKKYDEPDTVAFVNGVLGGFMRGEFGEAIDDAAGTCAAEAEASDVTE